MAKQQKECLFGFYIVLEGENHYWLISTSQMMCFDCISVYLVYTR